MKVYNKLVRDKIPEVIAADNGKTCVKWIMENWNPMICEVNANPGGIEDNQKLTGIDQTQKFVDYIVSQVY